MPALGASTVVERRERERRGLGDDALVRAALAHRVELAPRHALDRDAGLARAALDLVERAVGLRALGDEHALERHAGAQRLDDRVAALDVAIALPCDL